MIPFETDIKKTAVAAAWQAAELLKKNLFLWQDRQVTFKRDFDFVTQVDYDSEKMIIQQIKNDFPDHDIFAEEQGADKRTSEYQWIIDPLDGTTNFIHGFPFFSISIALKKVDQIIFGLVYDPLREETFYAFKNKGAYFNDHPIQPSAQKSVGQALIATGFPFRDKTKIAPYVQSFAKIFQDVAGIRRAGSAALDLCYTACGRVDGFWEIGLNPWDIAAGILIVQEAGGIVTDFLGQANYFDSGNVVAANKHLHSYLLTVTKEILGNVYMR